MITVISFTLFAMIFSKIKNPLLRFLRLRFGVNAFIRYFRNYKVKI
jgi:hypothetical protein